MSCGFSCEKLPPIIPSTTNKGVFEAEIEFCPRIFREGSPPADDVIPISTPGKLPFNDSSRFTVGKEAEGESSNLIEATAPVRSFLVDVP